MTRYFFGYRFVRFAKIIAVVVLIGGLGGAAVRYVQGTLEAASVRYEKSALVGARLFTLQQEWDRMKQLISHFLGQSTPPITDAKSSSAPVSLSEFSQLTAQLANLQSERDLVKSTVVRRFETSVMEIEGKLRAHASSLAEAKTIPPKATTKKPQSLDETSGPKSKTLFDSLNRAEITIRRDSLTEGHEFISLLKSSSENPGNSATLTRALDELANLERLLPTNLEIASRNPPRSDPAEIAAPPPKLTAEKVADQLEQVRRLVRSALLTDWSVDQALAQAVAEVERENTRCLQSSRALQRLWLSVITFIAIIIVFSLLTSFLILVLADLTQAFLDTAISTAVVAMAYQNTAPPDETDTDEQ